MCIGILLVFGDFLVSPEKIRIFFIITCHIVLIFGVENSNLTTFLQKKVPE
jgi:hypothetical protein